MDLFVGQIPLLDLGYHGQLKARGVVTLGAAAFFLCRVFHIKVVFSVNQFQDGTVKIKKAAQKFCAAFFISPLLINNLGC
ncbi:hypothetical protein [uncultured Pontibacter sp.]|uniref:hypothetical protein n=1 Tax=uncultured Pontibacter sp. TaxID=453356 RepID=UPI00261FE566|nr:hypothetical protein [uncultured Pontibacter sp.]